MDEVQIVLAIAVIYFIHRWWSKTSPPSPSSSSSSDGRGSGVGSSRGGASSSTSNPVVDRLNALVDSIPEHTLQQAQSLFPQIDERQLKWEFVRTGRVRSLEVVAQELLDDRYVLSVIPPGFQEPIRPPTPLDTPSSSSSATRMKQPRYESLISRLKLQDKASIQDREFASASDSDSQSDATTSPEGLVSGDVKGKGRVVENEYARLSLHEKKELMVLEARRRMMEKDRKKARAAATAAAAA